MRTESERFYDYIAGLDEWSCNAETAQPSTVPPLTELIILSVNEDLSVYDHDPRIFWKRVVLNELATLHEVKLQELDPTKAAYQLNIEMAVVAFELFMLPNQSYDIDDLPWEELPWFEVTQVEKLISR